MTLIAGSKLGPYEIASPLGAGGMGEVYRAKDTRLDRTVAIKVLPAHLSDNPDLKARFEREGRAISGLTHPHICTLHDIGHENGVDYLVMEFIQGETLAERLAKGALPVDQVLRYGIEIASALDKAHRSGVVHRDLKPGNIMLTKTGAKLLDFGLAKGMALGGAEPTGLTITKPITSAGTLLGTFQYMAPEQLEGTEADARTDIFAFGAVLYEMATGKRAFEGKSQASLISSIMSSEPAPISQLAPMTPPALDRLVRACLAKDPEERIQTAHDVLLQLRWIVEGGSQAGLPAPLIVARRSRNRLWMASTVALLAACAALAVIAFRKDKPFANVIRAYIPAPENTSFIAVGDFAGPVVVSPDGTMIAFTAYGAEGQPSLWMRRLDGDSNRQLAGTEGATFPFWSADGHSIGYFTVDKLRTIDVAGGPPVSLCESAGGRGGTWNKDGIIVFSPQFRGALYQVSAKGGEPKPLTKLDESKHDSHRWPCFCSDGRHVLYLAIIHGAAQTEDNALYVTSLDSGEPKLVMRTSANAIAACDRLLFLREGSLFGAPFDSRAGRLTGDPSLLATNVTYDVTIWRGAFSSSENGLLAFHTGQGAMQYLLRADRSGKELDRIGEPCQFYDLRLSPDDKRLVTSVTGVSTDIWVTDLTRGTKTRLSFESGGTNVSPCWSPDGQSIAYANIWLSNKERIQRLIRRPAVGGNAEILFESRDEKWPTDWSSDGKYLLFTQGHYVGGRPSDIMVLPMTGKREPFAFLNSSFDEAFARFSPDVRWVAYSSNESGRDEVYVAPFDPPPNGDPAAHQRRAGKVQISTSGGESPAWRRDGKELYFHTPDRRIAAVKINGEGDTFEVGDATPLFPVNVPAGLDPFDVSGDGQFFVVITSMTKGSTPVSLVTNWTAEHAK